MTDKLTVEGRDGTRYSYERDNSMLGGWRLGYPIDRSRGCLQGEIALIDALLAARLCPKCGAKIVAVKHEEPKERARVLKRPRLPGGTHE